MSTRTTTIASLLALLSFAGVSHAASPTTQPIRVVVYDDGGGGGVGPENVEKCLKKLSDAYTFKRVKAEDIRAGVLKNADVLVQPGGSGSKQAAALEESGRTAIKDFVKGGGGYVGICAGSYLASADYTWSLGILNAKVLDRAHWARGKGTVQIHITDEGKTLLQPKDDTVSIYYGQGPLLSPGDKAEPAPYTPLATFSTEIAEKGAPKGVMIGATAIARGTYGKGRVICISPHPEKTEGLDNFIRRAVDWTSSHLDTPPAPSADASH